MIIRCISFAPAICVMDSSIVGCVQHHHSTDLNLSEVLSKLDGALIH